MKTKTAFQFLKAELQIPKQITVDDADGTKVGNVPISELTNIMDKYAEEKISPYLNILIEICTDARDCPNRTQKLVKSNLITKAEKLNPFL